MKWTVERNTPDLVGVGATLLCDGEPLQRVVAFDTEEGWAEVLCTGQKGEGHSDRPHVNPDDKHIDPGVTIEGLCFYVHHGRIEVRMPSGEVLR